MKFLAHNVLLDIIYTVVSVPLILLRYINHCVNSRVRPLDFCAFIPYLGKSSEVLPAR